MANYPKFNPTSVALSENSAIDLAMNSDRQLTQLPVELTEQQLDEIAGGLDLYLSGSIFQENTQTLIQDGSAVQSPGLGFRSSQTFTGGIQFIGFGIKTYDDAVLVCNLLNGIFGGLFGGRK